MSLVDYASSSDEDDAENPPEVEAEEDEEEDEDEEKEKENRQEPNPPPPRSTHTGNSHTQGSSSSSHQQSANGSHSSEPSVMRLPDASLLLGSPSFLSHQVTGGDHSSRVAAAMAESGSRKRESNGSGPHPLSKHPRGNLRHSRDVPDTLGGRLVPPQLRGRSNVVTEDIDKLFVNRRTDGSH